MLIFFANRTLRSNPPTLARVAKLVAVEATHRVGNKQGHLHLQIADCNLFWEIRGTERQEKSVGGDHLPLLLQCHSVHPNHTLISQFVPDLNLRHVSEIPTPDYSPKGIQGLVNWDLDWSVNKSVCLEQVWAWAFLPHSTKKEPSLSLLMLFKRSSLKTLLNCERRQLLQRQIFIRRVDYQKSGPVCLTVHEHLIVGIRIWVVIPYSFFGLVFCCRCMLSNVSLRFVPTRHRVQQGDAHMRKLQQICTRAQNEIFSGDKKQSLILSEPLPSNRN